MSDVFVSVLPEIYYESDRKLAYNLIYKRVNIAGLPVRIFIDPEHLNGYNIKERLPDLPASLQVAISSRIEKLDIAKIISESIVEVASEEPKFPCISRIDSKATHGWFVRVKNGKLLSKLFSDLKNGGKDKALALARAWRDEQRELAGLPPFENDTRTLIVKKNIMRPRRWEGPKRKNRRFRSVKNSRVLRESKTGVPGVSFVIKHSKNRQGEIAYVHTYYRVQWTPKTGERKRSLSFRVHPGHEKETFIKAFEKRCAVMEKAHRPLEKRTKLAKTP